ncbi:MAG TPA: AMP-binding protein, partial [Pseudonocardiaceae bacterium]
ALHTGVATPAAGGEGARRLTVIGPALPGLEVGVADPDTGRPLPGRHVGEILVRGPSVATPEHDDDGVRVDAAGWLHTGDRGYLAGGDLVVCGRIKDVLVVAGRTIQPEEVELACAGVPGVRPGGVAAVPYPRPEAGTEGVAVVAELRRGVEPDGETAHGIRERVRRAVGVTPDVVRLVAAGTLPRTTSGKLRRHRVRP